MTPQHWWLRRVRSAGKDRGATLLLALIFITVISVLIVGMLTVAFANLRATTALREQAAAEAAADGAAQVAINALRRGEFSCAGGPNTLSLPPTADGTISAAVQCTPDPANSVVPGPLESFPHALLTLPQTGDVDGISIGIRGQGGQSTVEFAGNVSSTGRVYIDHGVLDVHTGTLSADECVITPSAGGIFVNGMPIDRTSPDPAYCDTAGTPDPNLTLPAGPLPSDDDAGTWTFTSASGDPQSSCNNSNGADGTARITFVPGVYTNNAHAFRNLFSCGRNDIVYDFRPGVYWFNFTFGSPSNNENFVWSLSKGTLIAGSPDPIPLPPVTTFPTTACLGSPNPNRGVTFVFGGRSQWSIGSNARVQVCATPPVTADDLPIALYGLKNPVGSVAAQSNCVITAGTGGCPTLRISGVNAHVYVQGATYLPRGWIDAQMNAPGGAFVGSFSGGIVARRFSLGGTGNVSFSAPFSSAPPAGAARAVVDLAVYVCPGAETCDTAGSARLTAKVALTDEATGRRVSVYAWNAAS